MAEGGDSWFFLTADYAFGYSLEENTSKTVEAAGGKVLGSVRHPLNNTDYSAFLLQAQASGAKVIGLASAGLDTQNAIKQAAEFGITQGGQSLAGLLLFITDVHGLGLQTAQGLYLTEGFYWDRDDQSREFATRFKERNGGMPSMIHASTYSAVLQYLKAIDAAGGDDSTAVAAKLKEMPVDDVFGRGVKVAANGRLMNTQYLMQVKTPEESTGGGTSDARFVRRHCPVVEFGLVGSTMHMVDERVPLEDLEVLTRIYEDFVIRWFASANGASA